MGRITIKKKGKIRVIDTTTDTDLSHEEVMGLIAHVWDMRTIAELSNEIANVQEAEMEACERGDAKAVKKLAKQGRELSIALAKAIQLEYM